MLTLKLKNIPKTLYLRLKTGAEKNRRSLNSEAIVCLEAGLAAGSAPVQDRLREIRALRQTLGTSDFERNEIETFKAEGRP